MSSASYEASAPPQESEPVAESFIVYPLLHGNHDLHPVRSHEWREMIQRKQLERQMLDTGNLAEAPDEDPNARFLAMKLAEGFRRVGQMYWPSRTIDGEGTPLPYFDPRDERHSEDALRRHGELVARFGVDNVIACRPARDDLMSPDRAPIDEVIFLVRGDQPLPY